MKKLLISALLINLLAACASQRPIGQVEDKSFSSVEKSAAEATSVTTPDNAATPDIATATDTASALSHRVEVDSLNDQNTILAKRSIYYPFDVYVVQDADKPTVQAHAHYLSEHANIKVRLEGNCDERGSNEYNLGLGQRRADGVMKMLQVGGVKDSQLDAVSYGEEKPKATGHDEASWVQNRRTDLNYR